MIKKVSLSLALPRCAGVQWAHAHVANSLIAVAVASQMLLTAALAAELPDDFVRISDHDSSIVESLRYATRFNITGAPLPGYAANICLLRRGVALALVKVQALIRPHGLSLKLLDCYRPIRAAQTLHSYSRAMKGYGYFNPHIRGQDVVKLGYIALASRHSSGTAVDVTLTRAPSAKEPVAQEGVDCLHQTDADLDGDLDMGSAYDCFDPKSWTDTTNVTAEQRSNRQLLRTAMKVAGFGNYHREWWHYSFGKPSKSYDIVISGK